jgi:DNA-binding transcriptional ArsR family regulator
MVKYEALDRTLTAIADPTRRQILARLGSGAASMTELAEPLAISLPGLIKHVHILEQARLVETRKSGRTRQCRLGPARLDDVAAWVDEYRERWEARLDRLESYLEKKRGTKEKENREGGQE